MNTFYTHESIHCLCVQGNCLNPHCICFVSKSFCKEECVCGGRGICENIEEMETVVEDDGDRDRLLDHQTIMLPATKVTCGCQKSECLTNSCRCHGAKTLCTPNCKCAANCQNQPHTLSTIQDSRWKGCHCLIGCSSNQCGCFKMSHPCTIKCKCNGCVNPKNGGQGSESSGSQLGSLNPQGAPNANYAFW